MVPSSIGCSDCVVYSDIDCSDCVVHSGTDVVGCDREDRSERSDRVLGCDLDDCNDCMVGSGSDCVIPFGRDRLVDLKTDLAPEQAAAIGGEFLVGG